MRLQYFKSITFFILIVAPLYAKNLNYFLDLALQNSPTLNKQNFKTEEFNSNFQKQSFLVENPILGLSYQNVPIATWPASIMHAMSGVNNNA